MTRFYLILALAGFAGCGFPVMGGYGSPDTDDTTDDTTDDDDDTTDTTDTNDGSGNGDGGDIVDQNGNRIAHVDDCGSIDWKDYRGDARSYLAVGAPRSTGSFWPHGQGIADLGDEAPSDFVGWNLEGEFYSSDRICGVVFRWSSDFESVRASITGCPGRLDLDDEPFGSEPAGRDCSWPAEGMSDAAATLTVDATAYLDGEWVEPMADYWCWGGADAGCGSHVIAIRDDLEGDFEAELYRGH